MSTDKANSDKITIQTVGVVGAGQMGAGIAQVAAAAGYSVLLWDGDTNALHRGMKGISDRLDAGVAKGKLTEGARTATLGNLREAAKLSDFAACDLVIEAIIEQFEAKSALFKSLHPILRPDALMVSNTSSISITRMAASSDRADRFMGVHFMNPVPIMKLVELIKGLQTSPATYDAVQTFCSRIEKTTVLAIDTPGFIVNRILCPMINEAIFLVQEGVKPEDIDNAMKLGTNQPMGPLTLADFVGLDTLLYIMHVLHRELGEDKYRPCPLLTKYVEAGWFGKKAGRGFYTYS